MIKPKTKAKPTLVLGPEPEPKDWTVTDLKTLPDFQRIYHISDIHIRPLQRHDEFRQVFDRLDKYLEVAASTGGAIAVITGDIFDNKTVFRPETFKLCRDMIKMIAGHLPLVVIAGNHDMMENNTNRLDAITPVVDDIPNMHYLKYSGLYHCPRSNVCLSVSSLYDKAFIKHQDIVESEYYRDDYQYLALYHGTLNGAKTDTGYVAADDADGEESGSSRYRSLADFDGYNAVLLGDIHKHQIMRELPPVAYAGSLIQQNHGEDLDGHGVLIWERGEGVGAGPDWSCQLHNIENQYGFVDIHCQDGMWINDDVELPPNCYARLVIKNCTETQIDIIIASLKTKVKTLNVTKRQCISDTLDDFEIPPDIKRKEDELDLIREQAELNHYDADKLIELHQEYQKDLDGAKDDGMSTAIWRPVTLEFKNMFNYGGGVINKVNFKRGTISITGGNTHGKTSIVNILMFALFGKTPLNPSPTCSTYNVINNNETSGYVKILLNHGGQYYLIERKTTKQNTKAVSSAVLNKLNRYDFSCGIWLSNIKGQKLENCCETRRNNNDSFIKELFGDINDFSLSNFLNKESSKDLLNMSSAEQLKALKKLFKLEIYDTYKEMNKTKLKEIEEEIGLARMERKTLQPMIDDSITEDLIARKEIMVKAETETLQAQEQQHTKLQARCWELKAEIQQRLSEIQPLSGSTEFPLGQESMEELEKFQNNPPISSGVPTEALRYRMEDLQRQIDTMAGTIATLSVIPELNVLQEDLDALHDQLKETDGIDIDDVTENQLNRQLGDLNSKLQIVDLQIKELQLVDPGGNGAQGEEATLEELRSLLVPLSTSLDAITSRLNEIGDLGDSDTVLDEENLYLTKTDLIHLESRISQLQAENRRLELVRDQTYGVEGVEGIEGIEGLKEQLYEVSTVKYAVTEADLAVLQEQHQEIKDKIRESGIQSNLTHDDLLQAFSHNDHDHTADGVVCCLSRHIVDDARVCLEHGDRIRKLDAASTQIQTKMDRIVEQLDINQQIDHNHEINAKISQLVYSSNSAEIEESRKKFTEQQSAVEAYELHEEYQKLYAEETLHWNNKDIQERIDSLESVEKRKQLQNDQEILNEKYTLADNQIFRLEVLRNIELVKADLKAFENRTTLEKDLSGLKLDLETTESQLDIQEMYDRYMYLTNCYEQQQIHERNEQINEDIVKIEVELNAVHDRVSELSQDITEQDNLVKGLKEALSVLSYRFQEQEGIQERLDLAEQRLIELEQDIVPHQEYNSIVGTKGITSKLLYIKIKSIEDYINIITRKFMKYIIHIGYDENKQIIDMVAENKVTGDFLSVSRLCGFEKLTAQIAFKRALNKFSYNSKSSLIIVDEAFDCIDVEKFTTLLPDAISLINQDYSNCLVISQRDISHISDSILTVNYSQADGYSTLSQR
jgi:DNA repair exonuclease SbcCD ATPase subunit